MRASSSAKSSRTYSYFRWVIGLRKVLMSCRNEWIVPVSGRASIAQSSSKKKSHFVGDISRTEWLFGGVYRF